MTSLSLKHALVPAQSVRRRMVLLVLLMTAWTIGPSHAQPWNVVVAGEATESEALAIADLRRYLGQVTGQVPALLSPEGWSAQPCPAVILGCPASNPLLTKERLSSAGVTSEGYCLLSGRESGVDVVYAGGLTPAGSVNATYGLLRQLGFGFYLGSEAIPSALPDSLSSQSLVRNPALRIRGVLPWYNFFNSPTTWDPPDHRALVDQLVRMGANFVGFHSYDSEPFAAYREKGKWVAGKRLVSTASPTWGTRPTSTAEFAGGTGQLYAFPAFGAATTLEPDEAVAIEKEQAVLRDALAYARRRGLHACMGFEANGNPYVPAEAAAFVARLNWVLDAYPAIDYLWIWQQEMRGARGTRSRGSLGTEGGTEPLSLYGEARRPYFGRVVESARANPRYMSATEEGKTARANEAARLEQFAQLALNVLRGRDNAPRLIIAGWGGEDRLLSAEYYEGLDKLLPKDVVFASLDFMIPRGRIDSIYGQLPPDRERWPIPWLEYDGDQWHPQPFLSVLDPMLRDLRSGGSQGVLGIHWRTREVEQNLGYLIASCWDPELTAERFLADYSRRCYGAELAGEMLEVERGLEKLGYRWVGGAGQAEYRPFSWGPSESPENVQELERLRGRVEGLLNRKGAGEGARRRLDWLLHRMTYVLEFDRFQGAAQSAASLLEDAASTAPEFRLRFARSAKELLLSHPPDPALREYARRITTRGEYGVLATINTKAVPEWRRLLERSAQMLSEEYTTPTATWKPEPAILLPRLHTTAYENESFELSPLVLGGKVSYVHYRRLGSQVWETEPLHLTQRWVYYAALPARLMATPGIEFGFSFSPDPARPWAYGPIAVTVIPGPKSSEATEGPAAGTSSAERVTTSVELEGRNEGSILTWAPHPDAHYYLVEGPEIGRTSTAIPFYPLPDSRRPASFRISAVKGDVGSRGRQAGRIP